MSNKNKRDGKQKKSAVKSAADKKSKPLKTLDWPVPGYATATLYFSGKPDGFRAIFVAMMPGFHAESRVEALIGDDITSDDLMDIDHFERVWPKLGDDRQFIQVAFVNRSQTKQKFKLGFDFDRQGEPEQVYPIEMEATGRLNLTIPVKLSN